MVAGVILLLEDKFQRGLEHGWALGHLPYLLELITIETLINNTEMKQKIGHLFLWWVNMEFP